MLYTKTNNEELTARPGVVELLTEVVVLILRQVKPPLLHIKYFFLRL